MRKLLVWVLLANLLLMLSIPVLPVTVEAKSAIVVPDDYPTMVSAIGNATNGDTILVRKGIHEGPINKTVVIDKSLSIIGEDRPEHDHKVVS